ncbi:MAG: hypothetical protein ACM3IH_22920 [Sphingobacteriales bacterium]
MSRRFGRQVGDWIKLRCGDLVADIADERHIGRVEAIRQGVFVTVRWLDTGWTSEVPIERLALATPRPKITRLKSVAAGKPKPDSDALSLREEVGSSKMMIP